MKSTMYFAIILAIVSHSCVGSYESNQPTSTVNVIDRSECSRMQVVEQTNLGGYIFYIIKVDDKEYFVNKNGGIVQL